MQDKPRIGTSTEPTDKIEIYNANYAPSGNRIGAFDKPWTTAGRDIFRMHATHAEALTYACEHTKEKP